MKKNWHLELFSLTLNFNRQRSASETVSVSRKAAITFALHFWFMYLYICTFALGTFALHYKPVESQRTISVLFHVSSRAPGNRIFTDRAYKLLTMKLERSQLFVPHEE